MSEELMITKEDLVNWLDRPPSNDDLDLIGFITTRLENFYKLEQELNQKNKIIEEIKNNLKNAIKVQEETYKKYKSANINIYYASANKVVLDLIEELEKGSEE